MSRVGPLRRLIDIGANLTDPMFRGVYHSSRKHHDDFNNMLIRSREYGIDRMIITGGSLEDSKSAIELANTSDQLYCTVGCHPTRCNEFLDHPQDQGGYLDELMNLALANNSKVVALGEFGLDYDRLHFCHKETQKIYFEKQLELIPILKLPLFLHNRNSSEDFLEILERHRENLKPKSGVVHSFDGSREDVDRILDLGLYIGINGCSLKTEDNLEVLKRIPSDKLMIETDCPWCEIKQSHAGYKHVKSFLTKSKNATDPKLCVKNRNEPMNLVQVLEVIAAVRDEDIETLSEQIYANTISVFF